MVQKNGGNGKMIIVKNSSLLLFVASFTCSSVGCWSSEGHYRLKHDCCSEELKTTTEVRIKLADFGTLRQIEEFGSAAGSIEEDSPVFVRISSLVMLSEVRHFCGVRVNKIWKIADECFLADVWVELSPKFAGNYFLVFQLHEDQISRKALYWRGTT
jgi:hypothetical protein